MDDNNLIALFFATVFVSGLVGYVWLCMLYPEIFGVSLILLVVGMVWFHIYSSVKDMLDAEYGRKVRDE